MPIKEIIIFTVGVIATVAITGGPLNLTTNLRKLEYQIMKETIRTDNWGNPSPWANQKHETHAKSDFRKN